MGEGLFRLDRPKVNPEAADGKTDADRVIAGHASVPYAKGRLAQTGMPRFPGAWG
jgi:hypothetical protein